MTERTFCVRKSEIIKEVANKKATVFAEGALAFSKCQLEKCHFMCMMGYYCTNTCTITHRVRRASYLCLTAIILKQTQLSGTQISGVAEGEQESNEYLKMQAKEKKYQRNKPWLFGR